MITNRMKVAIIGATSSIGQELLINLLKRKFNIVATYNKNYKIVEIFPKVEWKKLDIKINKKNYFKFLGSPDIIVNLAWPDIPNYKLKNHFKTFYYQKRLNYNLIKNGLKNLIILGTCYEYGKKNGKISEKMRAQPLVPYAIAKLKLLESILALKKKKNFKFTWLRPFFVYGKNTQRKTLFSLINEFHKKKITKLNVCGSLIRDFISINFLSLTIIKIIVLYKDFGVINVCSGKGMLLKNFIKKHLKIKKNIKKINMNGKNPNDFESNSFWGDNSKLKKITLL